MDIRCRICGEPWDADCLHDEVADRYPNKPWYSVDQPETYHVQNWFDKKKGLWFDYLMYQTYYKEIRDDFNKNGCEALLSYGANHNAETIDREKNAIYGGILDLFSDDIDAAASATDEWDLMHND